MSRDFNQPTDLPTNISHPERCERKPYPLWTYFARAIWRLIECSIWRLPVTRIPIRSRLLRLFGAKMPIRILVSSPMETYFPWELTVGEGTAIGPRVHFYNLGGLEIGSRVVISQDVYICGGTHDYTMPNYPLVRKPVKIEDDVWIAAGAFIGPGVTIGQGAVVGARSVVTKDVPPWKVVAGNPAVVIKDRVIRAV